MPEGERLQKVLARLGYGSRRACEELIREGRVTVDGRVAELGSRIDADNAAVAIDGSPVPVKPGLVYYLLNKPAGVVTTAADPQRRPTVMTLVPAEPRVFPVGRLDIDTEGLLLLTNDGELTHRLTHPSYGVEKEYVVAIEGTPTPAELRRLRQGVELEDGITAPAKAAFTDGVLRLVIHEGRNRQVRRMCEAIGHPVRQLVRVRIGPLRDPSLRPGQWRLLERTEIAELAAAVTVRSEPGQYPRRS